MPNPKATAEQLKEMLELKDGYAILDRNGRFLVIDREGRCLSDRSSAAGSLAVLRFLRAGYREGQKCTYDAGFDDGYWMGKAEGRKLVEEIIDA